MAVLAAAQPGRPRRVLSIGEAKWGKHLTLRHLRRLAQARDLLDLQGFDTSATVLTCYGGGGFDAELLTAAAADDKVLLVDTHRLYN